ncbi:MAG: YXWGXW repeat-containing protein [Gammaproteobacteria bacterium]
MKRIMTGLFLAAALTLPLSLISAPPASAQVNVGLSVSVGPPVLPVYPQPVCPADGYIWVPGYWAYGPYGYYWVSGAWESPPMVGFLWTPGYWAWNTGYYRWYPGYWGRHVGFYGGINYGHGYYGHGYNGGYWRNNHFYYNSAANNVNSGRIRFTYRKPVPSARGTRRVSYNGGKGGIDRRPTAQEQAWRSEKHVGLTTTQKQHREQSQRDSKMRYSNNHGRPATDNHVEHAKPQPPVRRPEPPNAGGNRTQPPHQQASSEHRVHEPARPEPPKANEHSRQRETPKHDSKPPSKEKRPENKPPHKDKKPPDSQRPPA